MLARLHESLSLFFSLQASSVGWADVFSLTLVNGDKFEINTLSDHLMILHYMFFFANIIQKAHFFCEAIIAPNSS